MNSQKISRKTIKSLINTQLRIQRGKGLKKLDANSQNKKKNRTMSQKVSAKKKKRAVSKPVTHQKQTLKSSKLQQSSKKEEEKSNPHFMTVADLVSGDFVQPSTEKQRIVTPADQLQLSAIGQQRGIQCSNLSINDKQDSRLQQTIGKIKQKQQTIGILNKTVQTKLLPQQKNTEKPSTRMQVYELQVNFYVERISQLQRQLNQKNKMLAHKCDKNSQFQIVVRNNRKLISENHRLREEMDLVQRQNIALKQLLLKKGDNHPKTIV